MESGSADTKIVIREAGVQDIAFMAGLRGGGELVEQTISNYMNGSYSPRFALSERAVHLALFGDSRAGYVAGQRTTRHDCDGELQWLNVAEEFRGGGIADALMTRMFAWFESVGAFQISVNVAPENVAARKVYARLGAERLNEHWMIWKDLRDLRQRS
jgi:ribosomal protein S18 acetylase RimI-like enzyme